MGHSPGLLRMRSSDNEQPVISVTLDTSLSLSPSIHGDHLCPLSLAPSGMPKAKRGRPTGSGRQSTRGRGRPRSNRIQPHASRSSTRATSDSHDETTASAGSSSSTNDSAADLPPLSMDRLVEVIRAEIQRSTAAADTPGHPPPSPLPLPPPIQPSASLPPPSATGDVSVCT